MPLLDGAFSLVARNGVSISCATDWAAKRPKAKVKANALKFVFIFIVGGFYGFFNCVDGNVLWMVGK